MRIRTPALLAAAVSLAAVATATPASATHSWQGLHWARSANPVTVRLGSNVSSVWAGPLATAARDWNRSTVLTTPVVAGSAGSAGCRPTGGRVEVCNGRYGATGWLGVASAAAAGRHISWGTVRLNDTYFSGAPYNTAAWRALVTCQEVGHTLGLDHQDENTRNANLGTCMDYTNRPGTNRHPNAHDYAELASIYAHRDAGAAGLAAALAAPEAAAAAPAAAISAADTPAGWGTPLRRSADGRVSLYRRDVGAGVAVYTFVTWA